MIDALLLVAQHPAAAGGTFNVTDGWPVTFRMWADDMARLLGVAPPRRSIPFAAAIPVAIGTEWWSAMRHRSQKPAELPLAVARMLGQPQDFRTDRLRALGWAPRVTYDAALDAIGADLISRR